MEIFVDFGLFELLASAGLAVLSTRIYSRKWSGIAFLIVSIVAPAGLLVLKPSTGQRWFAGVGLATALVNAVALAAVLQNGGVPRLKVSRRVRLSR